MDGAVKWPVGYTIQSRTQASRGQRGSGSHSADREGGNQDGAVLLRLQHVPQLILPLFLVDAFVSVLDVYSAS
jgi:hypothetical protein